MIQNHCVRVDAERVINRRENLRRMDGVLGGRRTGGVGFSVNDAAFDARTGNQRGVTIRPVIAAIGRIAISRSADTETR